MKIHYLKSDKKLKYWAYIIILLNNYFLLNWKKDVLFIRFLKFIIWTLYKWFITFSNEKSYKKPQNLHQVSSLSTLNIAILNKVTVVEFKNKDYHPYYQSIFEPFKFQYN